MTDDERAEAEDAEARSRAWAVGAHLNPACWYWPAPETCTFSDDDAANSFLAWWHSDQCAICGHTCHDLQPDHDHETGLMRGYLCRSCNTKEGLVFDEDSVYTRYRLRPPAVILGIRILYWNWDAIQARNQRLAIAAHLGIPVSAVVLP